MRGRRGSCVVAVTAALSSVQFRGQRSATRTPIQEGCDGNLDATRVSRPLS